MNYIALYQLKSFVRKYLNSREKLSILEVGSRDVMRHPNMIFRRYFKNSNWKFIGLDIMPGKNVDVVSQNSYHYPFKDLEFDVVISGCTMEHVEDIFSFIKELGRLSKSYIFVIASKEEPEHRYPVDCWRFMPDGFKYLFEKVIPFKILEIESPGSLIYAIAKRI